MPEGVSQRSRRRIPITAELLSAYLDDQVTPDERAAVEQAIAEDPTVAEQVRALSQTVAWLRALPRASVPRAFTLSEADVVAAHTPWWERNWRRLAFALYLRGAALVAAALLVVVVVADLRQGQPLPATIGAQGELTTAVARGELPASTTAVAAEGAQPAPLESPTPGETDWVAASPTPEAIVPEAVPTEEAPTGEAELPTSAMGTSSAVEIEPPALAVRPPAEKAESPAEKAESPAEKAESPAPTAEPSPTALPLPAEAAPPAEEPAEEGPLAAAPTMGGGLLEPLDQEGTGPVARGGGPPGAPGLGGAGGMGGAESPSDRRPSVFGFAPPPVDGGLPAVPVLETAEASAGPAVEALAMPTAAAVAAAAAAPEAPTVELPAEGAGVPTEPVAAPAAEALVVESPAEEAPAALARAAAPEATAASETLTGEPSLMETPAPGSSMAEAPTAMPTPSPTRMIAPTIASPVGPAAEESLATEAPTATMTPGPTPTRSSSPTVSPELPTPATPSESPTPPASPSPVPSPAATVQGEATASAGQQGGRAELGLRFGPWTLTPGQVRVLEVVLSVSVVTLLAASWLIRRR